MSENKVSITAKVPLTAQQQWETLMAHHCGRWQGYWLDMMSQGRFSIFLILYGASFLLTIGKQSPIPPTSGVG
ncbi:hypothetical protein [Microcoleus sp. K5-D4]|uniref:hypothetical protein n=1 Tax=Microcoleus sp. K5-D4 TaxID=2818801 RepID=UPI002FD3F305